MFAIINDNRPRRESGNGGPSESVSPEAESVSLTLGVRRRHRGSDQG
jgi:hypothetical protein